MQKKSEDKQKCAGQNPIKRLDEKNTYLGGWTGANSIHISCSREPLGTCKIQWLWKSNWVCSV